MIPFPLAFLTAIGVIALVLLLIKLVAEAGSKKACAHRALLRDATPPHEYTNLDGTKGRWP